MRIGELARRSGVAVPTIKYYLREGLLPAGTSTGPNQADYDDTHLHRLRLVRALIDIGGLTVAGTRDVLSAVDDPFVVGHELLGAAHCAIVPARRSTRGEVRDGDGWQSARADLGGWTARRGWLISPDAPALDQLADVVSALRTLGLDELLDRLDAYADAAVTVAEHDIDTVLARAGGGEASAELMLEAVVTGTVLGEAMFNALRLLAQEDASARRFGFGRLSEEPAHAGSSEVS
jgi:DNA-binding transcriptional MerR regulator